MSKIDECKSLFIDFSVPLVCGVSEAWLNDSIPDGMVCVSGYNVFHNDRKQMSGGGILIWTHSKFRGFRRSDLEHDNLESVWVEIKAGRCVLLSPECYC